MLVRWDRGGGGGGEVCEVMGWVTQQYRLVSLMRNTPVQYKE